MRDKPPKGVLEEQKALANHYAELWWDISRKLSPLLKKPRQPGGKNTLDDQLADDILHYKGLLRTYTSLMERHLDRVNEIEPGWKVDNLAASLGRTTYAESRGTKMREQGDKKFSAGGRGAGTGYEYALGKVAGFPAWPAGKPYDAWEHYVLSGDQATYHPDMFSGAAEMEAFRRGFFQGWKEGATKMRASNFSERTGNRMKKFAGRNPHYSWGKAYGKQGDSLYRSLRLYKETYAYESRYDDSVTPLTAADIAEFERGWKDGFAQSESGGWSDPEKPGWNASERTGNRMKKFGSVQDESLDVGYNAFYKDWLKGLREEDAWYKWRESESGWEADKDMWIQGFVLARRSWERSQDTSEKRLPPFFSERTGNRTKKFGIVGTGISSGRTPSRYGYQEGEKYARDNPLLLKKLGFPPGPWGDGGRAALEAAWADWEGIPGSIAGTAFGRAGTADFKRGFKSGFSRHQEHWKPRNAYPQNAGTTYSERTGHRFVAPRGLFG